MSFKARDVAHALNVRVELGAGVVIAALLAICVADIGAATLAPEEGVWAILDEAAHAATGLILLAAIGRALEGRIVAAVVLASVMIDFDHLPGALGATFLTASTPRPYTHSLVTVVVAFGLGLAARSQLRTVCLWVCLGLCLHFLRDLAEPGHPGVALLWPLSTEPFAIAYTWYAGLIASLAAIALALRGLPALVVARAKPVRASQDGNRLPKVRSAGGVDSAQAQSQRKPGESEAERALLARLAPSE